MLDVQSDVLPLKTADSQLIDTLSYFCILEANPSAYDTYDNLALPERIATLLGSSGGRAIHHLDPILNIFDPDFQWRPDLPTTNILELFYMIRHAKLLDVLEDLTGPEIFVSPIYHVNWRLAQRHLEFVERLAETVKQDSPARGLFYGFHVEHGH